MQKFFKNANHEVSTLVELLQIRTLEASTRTAYTFLITGQEEEQNWTYHDLDRQAKAIAALLQTCTSPGERAVLLYPTGLEYIAAFFGCLYAGVIAIPAYPPQFNRPTPRLQAIVANAQPTVILTTTEISANISQILVHNPDLKTRKWLVTDNLTSGWENDWQETPVSSDTLAFLQYTSGSTGTPKGVMVTHGNLLHNCALIHQYFEHSSHSQGVIWLPPYHDMGLIGGILQPLYGGFPVTLMSPVAFLQSPFRWLQAISRYKGTTSGGPNFAYDLCVRKISPEQRQSLDLSSWEVAFNGAEPIRQETLAQFTATFAPCGFRPEAFYSCYGLAEATLIVSGGKKAVAPVQQKFHSSALEKNRLLVAAETHQDVQTLIGCGQPALDQKVVIANPESRTCCQPDEIGEIWVSGASVAQGYWNLDEQTEYTFQAYLADTGAGPFMRTGDLGFIYNGELFITGRLKDLIIIRGRNHYPHDIELTVESSHPALLKGNSAAFSVEVDGEERLVVFQELDRHHRHPNVEEIVANIRQAVSENHELQVYAVLLLKTGSIPKTSSGKIQRHACRHRFLQGNLDVIGSSILTISHAPDTSEKLTREALLAVNRESRQSLFIAHLHKQIAQVLRFELSDVDLQQPLSTLGLDSLMAIELKNDLETDFGIVLPITQFLQNHSLEQLATVVLEQLTTEPSPKTALVPAQSVATEYPLSYGQRSLWFLNQLASLNPAYNIVGAVRIQVDLDIPALHRAFETLIARHPVLRSTIHVADGEPVQQIHPEISDWFHQEDASQWSETVFHHHLLQEADRPFHLEQGPLLRVSLFTRSPQAHILLLVVHHITADFWSLAVLVQELGILYQAEKIGSPITLAPLKLQYTDYVNWQIKMLASAEGERLWAYWQQQLAGELPVLNLPTDRPRPPVQTYHGATHVFRLSPTLTQSIKALSRAQGTTLYMTLLAAFQVLLYRYTGQEDLLVGSPTAGRSWAELAGLIGYFVNPLVLRGDLSKNPSFEVFLERVRQTVLDAFAHQDYPFTLLVERLQPVRDPSRAPLFQTMFVLHKAQFLHEEGLTEFAIGEPGKLMQLGELTLASFPLERQISQFDLTLVMAEIAGTITAAFEYNSDLFDAETIARMAGHLETLLQAIVADPQAKVATLPLLTASETETLLWKWNDTQNNYPENQCIHELFAIQVAKNPDAIAVVCQDMQITYGELHNRTNQLAHYLQSLGVKPEVRVGICVKRSLDLIIGILGILKAGGAYVPLDPAYPQERLLFMLEDAQVPILLTQQQILPELPENAAKIVCLDSDWETIHQANQQTPQSPVQPRNNAYIIYTSGSTGKPKGVMIEHHNAVVFIDWARKTFTSAELAGVLAATSICFDLSVFELFVPLCSGGKVILVENILSLANLAHSDDVTLINTVPSAIAELLRIGCLPTSACTINLAGEPLPQRLVQQLYQASNVQKVYNLYGPSEDTTYSTFNLVQPEANLVTIGRPIANTQVYILDNYLQPVPIGIWGELYIAGEGLARGYLNQTELTAQKFIPHPFQPNSRLYKTGDLVRYLPNADIEYLGRIDHQVKIRGFRIELGEIETVLRRYPAIQDTAVIVKENTHQEPQLVAYIVLHQQPTPSNAELRHFLTEYLPKYMIPAVYVVLDALPLTPNGKLDRRHLPAPDWKRGDRQTSFVLPRNPVEEIIAGIWKEVLEVKEISINDDFFDLGGHSLLATQVMSRLRQVFPVEIPLYKLFEATTITRLAELLIVSQTKPGQVEKIARLMQQIEAMSAEAIQQSLQHKQDLGKVMRERTAEDAEDAEE
jgi:amino acid adenylation domain-containing protein